MDFLLLTPPKLQQQIQLLTTDLNTVQSKIAQLLKRSESEDENSDFSGHIKLEMLRYERNTIRSKISDASAFLQALGQSEVTRKLLSLCKKKHEAVYIEIEKEAIDSGITPGLSEEDISILLQSMTHCYRKIESSHQDQISMMTQIHLSARKAVIDDSWLSRVHFALSKSRSFFSRKCHTIRKIREQISASLIDDHALKIYSLLSARCGHGFIENLHELMDSEGKKAA